MDIESLGARQAGSGKASPASVAIAKANSFEERIIQRVVKLLGGRKSIKTTPKTQVEVHNALVENQVSYAALFYLTEHTKSLREGELATVLGVSTRTLQRQKDNPQRSLPPDLGSKVWEFTEILAKAEEVLGGREEAERWLKQESMGLNRKRPIDLLRTSQGAELVEQLLDRMMYGVYN